MSNGSGARERPTDARLTEIAQEARWHVVSTVAHARAGHIGGPLSAIDLLVVLYFRQLRIDPEQPDMDGRDRFILSKGHSAIALYTVLALRGYLPVEELKTFDSGNSRLQGHPDMLLTPGVDSSSGSLGQGLSAGLGMALGAKLRGSDEHIWVMTGDGEMQEGMNWEAVLVAPRYRLDNLTLIIDLNGLQQFGWSAAEEDRFDRSEPLGHVDLAVVLRGFGWHVREIDGHDFPSIDSAFAEADGARGTAGRPTAIIAKTSKGRGITFTEGTYRWHNGVPSQAQLAQARAELGQHHEEDRMDA